MSLITWKPEFSVGSASVDKEHRELIESINALHVDLQEGANQDSIVEGLGEIYANVSAHFALEEKLMRDADYEGFAAHKDDHEALLDEIAGIIDAVELHGSYEQSALSSALDFWFSNHFRTHDAQLHGKLGSTPPQD